MYKDVPQYLPIQERALHYVPSPPWLDAMHMICTWTTQTNAFPLTLALNQRCQTLH